MLVFIKATTKNGDEYTVLGSSVVFDDDGSTVTVNDAKILLNGKEADDLGETFNGHHWSSEEVASQIIRYYINGNEEFIYSCCRSEVVQKKTDFIYESGHVDLEGDTTVPARYLGAEGVLDLVLVDKDHCSYYDNGSETVILRKDRSIATDVDIFYENEMFEAIEDGDYLYRKE